MILSSSLKLFSVAKSPSMSINTPSVHTNIISINFVSYILLLRCNANKLKLLSYEGQWLRVGFRGR